MTDSRDFIYCELVFNYAGECGGDLYGTSPLAPCDLDWWVIMSFLPSLNIEMTFSCDL